MQRLLASSKLRVVDLSAAEEPLPSPDGGFPPVFVLCGDEDFIIDEVRRWLLRPWPVMNRHSNQERRRGFVSCADK